VFVLINLKTKEKIRLDGNPVTIGNEQYILQEESVPTISETTDIKKHQYLFIDGSNEEINHENELFIQSLVALNNFSQKVSSILDFGGLLNVIMELAANIISTEKGFLILSDSDSLFNLKAAFNFEKEMDDPDKLTRVLSDKIFNLFKDDNSILVNNCVIKELKSFNSVICSKLTVRNSVIGYICLVNKIKPVTVFNNRDLFLVEALATQAAIAIDNSTLYEKVKTETDMRHNLQRYLPRNIVTKVLDSKINLSLVGELQNCSILFADICGFTAITESLQPRETVAFLNQYLTIMTKAIFTFNGSVDKFLGDGIMAVFGAPVSTPNHALEATLAALEMRNQLNILKEQFSQEFGIKNFSQRIGINTGQVIYGNVGSPQRMDFTVIGDSVNLAARMESNAPPGSILITKNTFDKVKAVIDAREWEPIKVKGKLETIKVYEVLDKLSLENIKENADNSIRMYVRVPLKTFVSIIRNNERNNGLIRDISIGGVSVGVVGNYKPSEEILMTFKLSNNSTFRNIKGIVKYIEKSRFESINSKNNLIMGVEFVDLPNDKSKELIDFVNSELTK
jgi:adenylate cyclase